MAMALSLRGGAGKSAKPSHAGEVKELDLCIYLGRLALPRPRDVESASRREAVTVTGGAVQVKGMSSTATDPVHVASVALICMLIIDLISRSCWKKTAIA